MQSHLGKWTLYNGCKCADNLDIGHDSTQFNTIFEIMLDSMTIVNVG